MSSKTMRFESLLEAVPDALVGMDQRGVIRFVNSQTESLFGYDRDDLIGQHIETLVPEPLWQIYSSHRDDYFDDPRTRSTGLDVELVGRRRDDTTFPVNISMSHIDTGDVLLVITAVHDVARWKRAVRAAGLIAAIVEYSDDAIIGTTLEGVVTSWNPAAERLYGYSSQEMVGRSVGLLAPEGRVGEVFANLTRVMVGQHVEHFETTRLRRDGSAVPISLTVAPIHNEEGVIVGASAIHRDVTEQRRAFEVAQRMAAIVESSEDAIFGRTLDGIVTYWNPAAERMFGYSSDEIIGQSVALMIPQDRRAEMQNILADIRSGKHVERLETIRVRKDGTRFPISLTVSPVPDEEGTIIGASVIARDVTEQRRAFEVAQRMEAIIESSDDAIISQSLTGIIESWNPAAERLYGYFSEEIIGRPISLLMPEDRRHEMEANLARIRAGQHVERLQTIRVRKDGTRFPISLTLSPICDLDGTINGASGIGRDLTEHEHAAQYARSLIEAALDPMVTISPAGRIDDVNQATVRITGVPRELLIGSGYAQYVTEPDKAREIFQQVFEQGSATGYQLTVRHRDGTLTDVVCNGSVYRDLNGDVLGVLSTGHDITRAKRAFETAQRMAAIVENSDEAIIGVDLDVVITSWNPAAERMYGYSRHEVVGRSIQFLVPQDLAHEPEAALAKVKAGLHVDRIETTRIRKDGKAIPIILTFSPIRNTAGAITGASVIHRDLSEQQHAARYARSLIEAALDPMVTISPEGKIDDVNEATVNVTGVPRHMLLGSDFASYFTDPEKAHEIYQQVFEKGSVTDYPLTLRHENGTPTDVLYNASVYRDSSGEVLGVFAAARDMSTQKGALEAAQRMAAMVEHSDDAIIGSTLEGNITSWNPAAERLYGYPSDRIVGRSVDLLSPENRTGEIRSVLAKIKAGRPVENFETVSTRKDGTRFPVKLTIAPIRDADGAVVGASAIARDVTEQRRALIAAQQMAAIVRGSDEAIISRTADGTITSWNAAAERMFGYSSGEIVGKSIELLTPQEALNDATTGPASISNSQPVQHLETNRVRKDGEVFPVALTVSPICDEVGEVSGASVIARDMTEQRRVSAAARLAAAIEFSGEAIIATTLEGVITACNPAAEKLFGYSSEQMIGKSDTLLMANGRTREISDLMAKVRGGERVVSFETIRARKDGTVFPISLTMTPIRDAHGEIVGASSTPRDITKQKEAAAAAQHLAAIVEFSADAIISYTLEGTVTSWNPAAERVFGYARREIIGQPIERLSPEGRAGEVTSILAMVKAGRPVEHHETMRVRKDGTAVRVSLTVSPIRSAEGAIVGLSAIARDLAGRSEA